jgi:transposase
MTTEHKLIKSKMGLLDLASYLHNVSEACRVMGYSRDTFYRVKKAYEEGGIEALTEKTRRKPCIKNRVPEEVEKAVLELALDDPSLGQKRVSDTLRLEGVFVSPGGVRSIWLRHGLETFKKRLSALEKVVADTGKVLTEIQLKALEKAKEEKTAMGEIETEHVGYLGSQDTYYVGAIKGVGRIYQQTFIDTYSAVGFAKLYTTKHPINAADMLNDRVIPVVKSQVPVFADTDAGQVNGIRGYDLSDPLAFILCVRRIAIHKMHYARVNPVHQAFFQIAPETGRMLLAEAQIFIQMVHGGLGPIYAGLAGQ